MDAPKPAATLKARPEDFVVDEVPLYLPNGVGEHVYITFKKRQLTTMDAVRRFADALGVKPRDVGVAGLKDKAGVTTQTISVQRALADKEFEARVKALTLESIEILDAKRHNNKLRTGHLRGNRFTVVLRNVPASAWPQAEAALARIRDEGVPNRFGEQRFGMHGDNVVRAREWLAGREPGPRDQRVRRLLCSALQSEVYNRVLAARVADGSWRHALAGDVLQKEDSGGIFVCADPSVDDPRVAAFEITPTGPLPGPKMKAPEGDVAALEARIAAEVITPDVNADTLASHAEGTRRALRIRVKDLSFSSTSVIADPSNASPTVEVTICFELESGAYATTVLGEVFDLRDTSRPETGGSAKDEIND